MPMFVEKKNAEEPLFYKLDLGVLQDASEQSCRIEIKNLAE